MPILPPSAVVLNPTSSNPAVPLTSGVIQAGDGTNQPWVFDLGPGGYAKATMTTRVTGSPVSCVVQLQGSVDGSNWTVIATSTSTTGDTVTTTVGAIIQFTSLRVNISATSGGTNPTISVAVSAFSTSQGATSTQITSPVDSSGNIKIAQPGQSVAGGGSTAAGPTAGTSITTATAVVKGTYLVQFVGGFGATAETTTLDNIGLKINATFFTAIPIANLANTISQAYTVYLSLQASDQVSVYVINNASALAVYKGYISLTQVE